MKKRWHHLAPFYSLPSLVLTVLELTCALEQVAEWLFIKQGFNSNNFDTDLGSYQHRLSGISFPCLNILEFRDESWQLAQTLPNVSFPFSFPIASSLADLTIPVVSLVNSLSLQWAVLVLLMSCLIWLQSMDYSNLNHCPETGTVLTLAIGCRLGNCLACYCFSSYWRPNKVCWSWLHSEFFSFVLLEMSFVVLWEWSCSISSCLVPKRNAHWWGTGFVIECEIWEGLYLSFNRLVFPWNYGLSEGPLVRGLGVGIAEWARV